MQLIMSRKEAKYMSIPMLECISITDQDIDEVEVLLGDVSFDQTRREIIKNLESFDVQAFPGSGKTTVLIAKLAILAKKWPYSHKGICVLSHTNVAKDEIDRRLGQTEIGRKLLSYPHFIGTLHSFCDTYVSIPWLKSKGYVVSMIDTDITLIRRWSKLKYGTRNYLQRKGKNEYACEAKSFPVTVDVGCSSTTATYQQVKNIIEESQKEGYYTFDEMLQIAKYASSGSVLCSAIQSRFPLLLIDEAQDTSEMQYSIISSIFNNRLLSVMQAYGDANQAIFQSYNSNASERFPLSEHILTMANSHRFDNTIAKLADCFAVSQKGMIGDATEYTRNQKEHTIFLFDKGKIEDVIQVYASHILKCFNDDEISNSAQHGCYIVGMVHNKEPLSVADAHFPNGLRDYYTEYDPIATRSTPQSMYLIDYFRNVDLASDYPIDSYLVIESISKAFRRIIQRNSSLVLSTSSRAFHSLVISIPEESQITFRKEIYKLIQLPFSTQEEWKVVVKKTKSILQTFFGISSLEPLSSQWINQASSSQGAKDFIPRKPKNVITYTDESTNRSVDIRFASIHSVKGQTHLATLVVETYWYSFNLKSILPCLCGKEIKKPNARDSTRMKCHYVALTRARGLVCVALPKDEVSEQEVILLRNQGWNIVSI